MIIQNKQPVVFSGKEFIDDRGALSALPALEFKKIKRFYVLQNFQLNFVRAWHGHQFEEKFVWVIEGAAVVGAVAIHDFQRPDPNTRPHRFVLSGNQPSILYIPGGYANGFMNLTAHTKILFFSSSTLEESKNDDVRFPARFWDIWNVEER